MAFPFIKAPKFQELVDQLVQDHGCQLRTLHEYKLRGPRGDVAIQYLVRQVDGKLLASEPLATHLDDCISPDSLRRLIVQLQLPKSVWIWAGDPYDPSGWDDAQNCH